MEAVSITFWLQVSLLDFDKKTILLLLLIQNITAKVNP